MNYFYTKSDIIMTKPLMSTLWNRTYFVIFAFDQLIYALWQVKFGCLLEMSHESLKLHILRDNLNSTPQDQSHFSVIFLQWLILCLLTHFSGDFNFDRFAEQDTYMLSNIAPQSKYFNRNPGMEIIDFKVHLFIFLFQISIFLWLRDDSMK